MISQAYYSQLVIFRNQQYSVQDSDFRTKSKKQTKKISIIKHKRICHYLLSAMCIESTKVQRRPVQRETQTRTHSDIANKRNEEGETEVIRGIYMYYADIIVIPSRPE